MRTFAASANIHILIFFPATLILLAGLSMLGEKENVSLKNCDISNEIEQNRHHFLPVKLNPD